VVGYELCGIKGTRDAVTEPLNTGCIRMEGGQRNCDGGRRMDSQPYVSSNVFSKWH